MANNKYNRVLIALIILGLVAALAVNWQRHRVEENNTTVELIMDYEDIVELAQLEGRPVAELMPKFKEAGLTSLAVYDTTLEKLNKNGKVTVFAGAHLLAQYRTGVMTDPFWRSLVEKNAILPEDVYIIGQDPSVFAEVESDLNRRLGPDRVRSLADTGRPILVAKANYEKVLKWNLGLSREEMQTVSSYGYLVVPRPTNFTKVGPDDINAVFSRLNGLNVSSMIFVGDEVVGYPGLVNITAQQMKERNITLGMIEHPLQLQFLKQDGLLDLAALNNYNAARMYVIPKDEQPKLKLAEAVHRWVLTDQERNIRLNLLRKYDKPEPNKNLVDTNLNYVSSVKTALEENGFTIGRAGTYATFFPQAPLLAVEMAGATAAGVLLLAQLIPLAPRRQYILVVLFSAVLIFPVLKGGGTLVRQAAALMSAISFPVLAMTWQLDKWMKIKPQPDAPVYRIMRDGLWGLICTTLLSLVGGLYVASLLADVRFLLEIQIFRGVKLTFVAPLILISLIYLKRYNLFGTEMSDTRGIWQQVVKLLNYPVYIKSLLIFGFAALAAWVFVGRSGHTAGVPVPEFELKARAFLESAMYARPREKEFLIGHPAFMLVVMALYRNWPRMLHYALVVAAVIGQGSLVETFAHIRTPVFMSIVRGFDGVAVGAIVGLFLVIGVQVLHYLSYLLGRGPAADE